MAGTSLHAPTVCSIPSFPAVKTLTDFKFPITFLSFSHYTKSLKSKNLFDSIASPQRSRRLISAIRVESINGATEPTCHYDFDLFTLGAASVGLQASRSAANFGAKVALCELPSDSSAGFGGACALCGDIPKKLFVYASKFVHEYQQSGGFGWYYEAEPKNDWSTLMANMKAESRLLSGVYQKELKNAGIAFIEGRGKIVDPHTVEVNGKLYRAKHILISVDSSPSIPDIPGSEYAIDSDAAFNLPSKPKKLAIVGDDYAAIELASTFNGMTVEVHVFTRQKKVLRGFDEEIRDFVKEQMSSREIEFHTEETPETLVKSSDGLLSLKTNNGTVDGFYHVMFATGRKPNAKNLGLEAVGVKLSRNGAIEVDEYSRTSIPSIWAVGDVTDRINLIPVALIEGEALAKTLFANEPTKPDYSVVASAVFSQPPIAQVGLNEEQAIKKYGDIDVYTANFRPLKSTLSGLPDRVFVKLIVCAKTNKVLGLHMCGEDSPEIVQGFAVALKAGLTKADFDATLGIHPTAAEELVTMRTPTRKVRNTPLKAKVDFDIKVAALV